MTLRLPKTELPAELKENMIKQLGIVPVNVEVLWHSPRAAQVASFTSGDSVCPPVREAVDGQRWREWS
uniref:Uncharacterized protein n=1 Tax=Streptomyces sp. NBC_01401 TaxID=2903854 RepID=A0AAU3H9V5_9ACTN